MIIHALSDRLPRDPVNVLDGAIFSSMV